MASMPALRDTNDCGEGDTHIAVGRSTTRTMQQIELVGGADPKACIEAQPQCLAVMIEAKVSFPSIGILRAAYVRFHSPSHTTDAGRHCVMDAGKTADRVA